MARKKDQINEEMDQFEKIKSKYGTERAIFSVGLAQAYQNEQQENLKKYMDKSKFDNQVMISGGPTDLIPADKILEYTTKMQDIDNKYLFRIMGIDYSMFSQMTYDEYMTVLIQATEEFGAASFTAIIDCFHKKVLKAEERRRGGTSESEDVQSQSL